MAQELFDVVIGLGLRFERNHIRGRLVEIPPSSRRDSAGRAGEELAGLCALAGLVERGLISSGRAAELAGVSRREFLDWCGRWHVRIHQWDAIDLEHDMRFAEAGAKR